MSAWMISLPFLIGIAISIEVMVATGLGSYGLIRRIPADESDESATRWTRFYFAAYAVLIGIVLYPTVALNYPFQSGRVSPQPFEPLSKSITSG